MPRPFTRAQALENQAFLKALLHTGNARLAARETGVKYSTMQHRRAHHPALAQEWEAALAFALAQFEAEGLRPPAAGKRARPADPRRTAGGEPVVVRRNDGRLQMRRAQPGKLTRTCEQAFLAALSATANVRLSAAAAGASPRAFYRRRRDNPAFAREYRLALAMGYQRLELALLESSLPESFEDDHWRHNDPPPVPPMTVNQALQLMYLHQKEALGGETPFPLRLQRGETSQARSMRLTLLYEARTERRREEYRVAQAAKLAGEGAGADRHAPPPPALPDLGQVRGWSKADAAKEAHHPERALFGGWRLGDLEGR
jgi:hypothetical protein